MSEEKKQERGRRRNRAEAAELVAEYRGSGLSQQAFCETHGIGLATLARYRKRQGTARCATACCASQVELWFAKIQRDAIRRGIFTSVADLGNKLRRYIRLYSKSAKPFRWTYTDPTRRIVANRIAGTAY